MMPKVLVLSFILLSYSTAHADTEVVAGALTYHFMGADKAYKHRLSNDGAMIANPIIALRAASRPRESTYRTSGAFIGLNSLGRPMGGYLGSVGTDAAWGRFGIAMGGYMQDNRQFVAHNIQPPSWISSGGFGLVVLGGLEYSTKGPIFLNLLLTPAVSCASIGFRL
jgi:hypothetical protein